MADATTNGSKAQKGICIWNGMVLGKLCGSCLRIAIGSGRYPRWAVVVVDPMTSLLSLIRVIWKI